MNGPQRRYAARMLFQMAPEGSDKGGVYEARIVTLKAPDARGALGTAKEYGASSQWKDDSDPSNTVECRFLGVIELLNLEGATEDENEVWFDILEPNETVGIVPPEESLSAIRNNE